MNTTAKKILAVDDKPVNGKHIDELAKKSNLLKTLLDNKQPNDLLKVHLDGKTAYFQQKNIEIVVPNLKPNLMDTIQFSGFLAGMIYILKDVSELKVAGSD